VKVGLESENQNYKLSTYFVMNHDTEELKWTKCCSNEHSCLEKLL